jgi:hypothetical protein
MVKLQSSKLPLWVRIPLPLLVQLMWFLSNKTSLFLRNIFQHNVHVGTVIFLILDWFLVTLRITKSENTSDSDNDFYYFEWEKKTLCRGIFLSFLDFLFLTLFSYSYKINKKLNQHGFDIKLKQISNNTFYSFNNTFNVKSTSQTYLYGLRSIWKHLRFWILPLSIVVLFVYFSFFLRSLPFAKIIFGYVLLANLFYLLISGFVFFIKKYQYRLYTTAIQRFWRRSLIIFWAIEASLFITFVYLMLNANQEPVYTYDNIQIYKTHFYSWRYFLVKIFLSSLLIILTYLLLLSLRWNTFTKTNNISIIITLVLLYITWLEFYQFFHLMNCYGTSNWVYDFSEHLWNLELEFKRTRIVNHYVTIALVAKFWHIVFAVVFWVFFILRGVESSRYRYPLLSANLQNFLIIYIMSWLYMYPWFKFSVRKALDMPYFWFFVNNRKLAVFLFFNDIKLYYWAFTDYLLSSNSLNSFRNTSYFYWHESSLSLGNSQFRKHNIRDMFIRGIN